MVKISKKILISALILITGAVFSSEALAQWTAPVVPAGSNLPDQDLRFFINNIIGWTLGMLASTALLFLIYGGVKYLISTGDESQTEEAKTIIRFAIWGVLFSAMSYALVKVIVNVWILGSF